MVVINPHTTRATGTILTAAIYNADHQNHITNANNLNAALIALSGVSLVTGFVINNGAGVFSGRTLQAGTGIDITNPDGLAGDPTILIEPNVALPGNASSVGSFTVGTTLTVTGIATFLNSLVLKSSVAPANTAEGSLEFDSDGDFIVAGDGVAQKFIGRMPNVQTLSVSGNYTKTPGARWARLVGCGAGAGAGGVDGQTATTSAATAGGGSGFSGYSDFIDISGVVAPIAFTIGAGGPGGVASAGGTAGTATTITINAQVYTWGGGFTGGGGAGLVAAGSAGSDEGGSPGTGSANLHGSGQFGQPGIRGNQGTNTDNNCTSGAGGCSWFGNGGAPRHIITATAAGGLPGGIGAGGSGAVVNAVATNANGGAGGNGILFVEEYF